MFTAGLGKTSDSTEELGKVAGEREVFKSLLKLLPPSIFFQISGRKWKDGKTVEGGFHGNTKSYSKDVQGKVF